MHGAGLSSFRFFAMLSALLVLSATTAYAERRVALVVGNAAYQHATRLTNPLNDARDVRAKLEALGFEVVHGTDLTGDAFDRLVQTFISKAAGADLALFYYAGHGVQFDGSNYLVPIDIRIDGAYTLQRKAVPAQAVMEQMERAAKASVVFLDACRNNTLMRELEQSLPEQSRSLAGGRGLARMEPKGANSLIAFATAPNTVAADGTGRNSPFTAALLKHIENEGVVLQEMLTDVTAEVVRSTDGRQKPEVLSRLTSKIWLKPKVAAVQPVAPPVVVPHVPPAPAPTSREREASVAWETLKSGCDRDALALFRNRYNDTFFGDMSARRLSEIAGGRECAAPPARPLTEEASFVRSLQTELKRIGCYDGSVDGKWGDDSGKAFAEFLQYSQLVTAAAPTKEHLDRLLSLTGRVCPLVCDDDEREVNGRCIAKSKPAEPQVRRSTNRPADATPTRPIAYGGPAAYNERCDVKERACHRACGPFKIGTRNNKEDCHLKCNRAWLVCSDKR